MNVLHEYWEAADIKFRTSSDIGGVRIGGNGFFVNVPNGFGDGTTHVGVFNNSRIQLDAVTCCCVEDVARYWEVVDGKFNIFSEDCGRNEKDIEATLEGRYGIYYKDGYVFFVRWGDK